jgi:lipid A 4'-phosphatase
MRNWIFAALVISAFFLAFPRLDIAIINPFFNGQQFIGKGFWLSETLADMAGVFVAALLLWPAWQYWRGKYSKQQILIAIGTVLLGAGLLVNAVFKDNWGRARPKHVLEFGGQKNYTPPLQPANQCTRNCSFTSGDASVGFCLYAYCFMFPAKRRQWFLAGTLAGLGLGVGRMSLGAHFFSDVLYSGLLVYLAAIVLAFYTNTNKNTAVSP